MPAAKRSTTAKARTRAQRQAKAAPAKSNGAKAKPAAKAEVSKREAVRKREAELAPKVKKARDSGKSWTEIKEMFGVDQPRGQVLLKMANLKPEDRITFKDDAALGKIAARLRDKEGLPWADIAVRAGVTNAHVKRVYQEATGKDPAESRILRAAGDKPAPKAAKPAAAKAKATAAKPATRTRRKGKAAVAVGGGKDPS